MLSRIVRAKARDLPKIKKLARKLDLYTEDLRPSEFLLARRGGRIIGLGRIKNHGRVKELSCLGVVPRHQRSGVGRALVAALIEKAAGTVYAATIKPDYFRRLGFTAVRRTPGAPKRPPGYCRGCHPGLCRVLVYRPGRGKKSVLKQ